MSYGPKSWVRFLTVTVLDQTVLGVQSSNHQNHVSMMSCWNEAVVRLRRQGSILSVLPFGFCVISIVYGAPFTKVVIFDIIVLLVRA